MIVSDRPHNHDPDRICTRVRGSRVDGRTPVTPAMIVNRAFSFSFIRIRLHAANTPQDE